MGAATEPHHEGPLLHFQRGGGLHEVAEQRPRLGPLVALAHPHAQLAVQAAGHQRQLQVGVDLHRHRRGEGVHVEEVDRVSDRVLDHHAPGIAVDHLAHRFPQAVRHQQHRVLVAEIQDSDLADRPRIPPQLHRLVEGPRMAVAPADMVQFDPAPLRGGRGPHGLDQLRRTPPQGQETDAELVELGQDRPGGQGAVEDQFLGIGPRPLPAEVREPERSFGAGLLAHGGLGVAEDPGVDAAGEEGEDALLAAAAFGNIVFLDQGVVPMVGNGVEIEVEGGAPRQGRLAEGLGQAALERSEAARIDAAGVFGESRVLEFRLCRAIRRTLFLTQDGSVSHARS